MKKNPKRTVPHLRYKLADLVLILLRFLPFDWATRNRIKLSKYLMAPSVREKDLQLKKVDWYYCSKCSCPVMRQYNYQCKGCEILNEGRTEYDSRFQR